jgi:CubicO group peptidase (beta-lactamase class C family)
MSAIGPAAAALVWGSVAIAAPGGISGARHALDQRTRSDGVHGYALAMAPDQGPIWTGAAGGLHADSRVALGSASGVLTTLAVVKARDNGLLGLGDPVTDHLPWLKLPGVTVGDLLDHTSGISPTAGDRLTVVAPADLATLANQMMVTETLAPPGVHRRSAANDLLAGLVLQAATNQPYADALHAQLLRPLALLHTGPTPEPRATGHRVILGRPVASWASTSAATPALGLFSTARDLGRLGQHLVSGSSAMARAVLNHDGDPWHLGWAPLDLDGIPAMHHPGDGADTLVDLVLIPRKATSVMLVSDTGGAVASLADPRPGVTAALWVVGQPPEPHDGIAQTSLMAGLVALAVLGGLTSVLVLGLRRRPTAAAGWVAIGGWQLCTVVVLGAAVAVTVRNPAGPVAWRMLARQQPDAVGALGALVGVLLIGAILLMGRAARR